jgi:hypothetical protein
MFLINPKKSLKVVFWLIRLNDAALRSLLALFKQHWFLLQKKRQPDVDAMWKSFVENPTIGGASDSFGKKFEVVGEPKLKNIDETVKAWLECYDCGEFQVNRSRKGFNMKEMENLAGYVFVNPSGQSKKDFMLLVKLF